MPALTNALARFIRPGQGRGFAGLLLAAADRLPLRADAEAPSLAPLPEGPAAATQDPAESLALARIA
ncbi:hypothetical protein [Belnapia sp. F-4-1]|uniref:hypothetical protein n=1 Tax=Belnapia sp. F-4-1 TaxID=1545443 RepID=UPI0005BAE565|nr:hypothetical protein [Belnapia sp. F-4-1]